MPSIEQHPRLRREARTIAAMIRIYCGAHHVAPAGGVAPAGDDTQLCEACTDLLAYAHRRLARCPYQERKPTCAKCPIHCYQPNYRDKIKSVMRYAGPRMILRHPLLALQHLVDSARKPDSK